MEGRKLDEPVLPSVQQWLDWKMLNVLPRWGGTLDQDAEFMSDLRFIIALENGQVKQKADKEAIRKKIKELTGR